jgi:hypothetical protein
VRPPVRTTVEPLPGPVIATSPVLGPLEPVTAWGAAAVGRPVEAVTAWGAAAVGRPVEAVTAWGAAAVGRPVEAVTAWGAAAVGRAVVAPARPVAPAFLPVPAAIAVPTRTSGARPVVAESAAVGPVPPGSSGWPVAEPIAPAG